MAEAEGGEELGALMGDVCERPFGELEWGGGRGEVEGELLVCDEDLHGAKGVAGAELEGFAEALRLAAVDAVDE